MTTVDYLTEDTPITGQLFCVLSFLSPEGVKNCSMRGIKIRGSYPTQELAEKRAEHLRKVDPYFDIFVAEVGKWCPWDDKDKSYNQQYNNDQLNSLMKAYKENKDKSNLLFEQRKNEMQTGKYEDKRKKKMKDMVEKKLNKNVGFTSTKEEKIISTENTSSLDEIKKETENKQKELDVEQKKLVEERKEIIKKEISVNNMEERLKKVEEIYKKISQK